jgi:hypothetical protein
MLSRAETDFLETGVAVEELDRYVRTLHRLMDIGIVVSLNVFQDWINRDNNVKDNLRGRTEHMEDLELEHSLARLREPTETIFHFFRVFLTGPAVVSRVVNEEEFVPYSCSRIRHMT